jgi:hypothetical protein
VGSKLVDESRFTKSSKAEQKFTWDITGCLMALVLSTTPDLLIVLVCLEACPPELLEDALSCLLILSEDNEPLANVICDSDSRCLDRLIKLKDASGPVGVSACGVLHNMFSALGWHDNNVGRDNLSDAVLVPVLSKALEPQYSHPPELLQLALEILAAIGTEIQTCMEAGPKAQEEWHGIHDGEAMNEDDQEAQDEEGDQDEDHEMNEDEIEADMSQVTSFGEEANGLPGIADMPTLEALRKVAVPRIVSVATRQVDSPDNIRLQSYALSTLSNIAWSISCIDFSEGHNADILKPWQPVARSIWENVVAATLAADTADLGLAAKVTSLAWALSRTLCGMIPLAGDPHRKFMALYQTMKGALSESPESDDAHSEDPLQSLGVKCIGVLGQLAMDPAPVSLNREIGIFLVTVVSALPETPVADAVEALNQLFDIYGDGDVSCDEVFWENNFLQHLEEVPPKLRAAAKKIDKRSLFELRSRADEALLNLGRFLQYKKKHKPED